MTTIKRITLKDRLRDAVRAFRRVPVRQIQLGLKVERCDECELQKLKKLPNCNDCAAKSFCGYAPKPGEPTRVNCPLHRTEEATP